MAINLKYQSYHETTLIKAASEYVATTVKTDRKFQYTFRNFFHPFVGELTTQVNRKSLAGTLDPKWQASLAHPFFESLYQPQKTNLVEVNSFAKEIDVSTGGPYAVYNWELFFHIPLTIAVHLSKSQRFAEAQRWFHYIFDPTCTDTSVPAPQRYWRFLAFRSPELSPTIYEIVRLLSIPRSELSPADQQKQDEYWEGYATILTKPFQPHAVARSRQLAYQYNVVMKYLDNLIAWGDFLFQQDTVESINEATQRYVLAANLLGPRPQQVPPRGKVRAKTFHELKRDGLGPIGDALVELEGQFPFNLAAPLSADAGDSTEGSPVFGIGRTLYFCIPRNDKLLGYWDIVADRLFKIRHCMNIAGVVRPLALFDPPLDPGMLVKAAAAGIDISSIVNGLNQPVGPVRALTLIQKALELCGEVRSLGGALLSALEKGDAEHLALTRQRHEIQVQTLAQEVRYLQWRAAQEGTRSLLTNRATALERLRFYQRVLGLPADRNAPDELPLEFSTDGEAPPIMTEESFDAVYGALVGRYDKQVTVQTLPQLRLAGGDSAARQGGAEGAGRLYLNRNEDAELNQHLPTARDTSQAASVLDTLASVLTFIPEFDINLHFWGMGASSKVFGGSKLSDAAKIGAGILRTIAAWEQAQAGMAARTAGHERRADDWMLQYNLAAHELMQNGRQILTSLISEQVAYHEYRNIKQQISNAHEVDELLRSKFTNEELYLWMQGEVSRLYYEYYRFAFDTARKAERTMKQEIMRPELDGQDFVKFNYWDGGRKGLLAGEALHLDVKRMEMAYHENNKRELELVRHVSLRQLDPLALLTLKATGSCIVTVPEWLYDRDCPGHYMRRIRSVALSIPSVVGPYTSVNCTLSLLRSSLRKSPMPKDGEYTRQGPEDDRFVDTLGAVSSIVTSTGNNDSGLFETNLRDDRFLPFEGAGAESTWKLDLPTAYPAFDYATIADVILHIRYTARQGVNPNDVNTHLSDLFETGDAANLALLFSLRYDFPTEWLAFVHSANDFAATIRREHFPYATVGKEITIARVELYDGDDVGSHAGIGGPVEWAAHTAALEEDGAFTVTSPATALLTRTAGANLFLVVRYTLAAA